MFGLENAQSLVGVFVTMGICWALSENRSAFPWKLAIGAIAVQAGLVLLLFGLPAARSVLAGAGAVVERPCCDSTQAGVKFVFGYLAGADGQLLYGDQSWPACSRCSAFRVLPVDPGDLARCLALLVVALGGILKWVIQGFSALFERTMGLLRGLPALGGDRRHRVQPGGCRSKGRSSSAAICRRARAPSCSCCSASA